MNEVARTEHAHPASGHGSRTRTVPLSPKDSRPGPWLTAGEAAEYLRLPSVQAVYKRVERGQLPVHRFGRLHRFRRAELDALLEGGRR
jgi:excisionase family DNA binding protein